MAEFPAMPLWTDAYLADTGHLTTLEHGAYMLLLMAMWRAPSKSLPADDLRLARTAKLTLGQWNRVKHTLLEFLTLDEQSNTYTQGRLTDEANAVRQHSTKQSDKAKARWLKNKNTANAAAMPEPCRKDASLTLTLLDSSLRSESIPPVPSGHPPAGGNGHAAQLTQSSKRGSRLPDDWDPGDEGRSWALKETGLGANDIHRQTDMFRDWAWSATGAAARKSNWNRAWKNWIRRADDERLRYEQRKPQGWRTDGRRH